MSIKNDIALSLETGLIDQNIPSKKIYRPELLTNNKNEGKKVLTKIITELEVCDEFWFSVAFVTTSGVATLINSIIELQSRGVKGKILCSQYLNFTHPEALSRLKQLSNIELKIAIDSNFHSKGYLFKVGEINNLIIGSSNLTQAALSSNKEWNLKVSGKSESELISQVRNVFEVEWDSAEIVTNEFIEGYRTIYNSKKERERNIGSFIEIGKYESIKPNSMQKEALINLEELRSENKSKALLISATGTGKTYLSAFDVKKFKPKKFLFVVHRRTIALEAMKTFKSLLGGGIEMGLYSSNQQNSKADYLFATVQTISKQEHLDQFESDHFDYIVIDETHRAGASSYERLMEHFSPKFLLGMTATPERTDGFDVFKLFDYNIAYEIRLHRAMDEEMLSPFHYYGVTDLTINNKEIDDTTEFNLLVAEERIDRIIEKINIYGCDVEEITGLIFCSRKSECNMLSEEFNKRGFRTISLTGENSEEERTLAIDRLESKDSSQKLDYIFTVDIFNEGIDIPLVNQIVMLRPTQSAIIFVQQLGRGLRKALNKEYLTVIDFIGNYKQNYMVPVALYGDTSFNKDMLRKLMSSGSRLIPGCSTINFDRIAKEKIYASIDSANMKLFFELKKDYQLLKYKLGHVPMMMDFINHSSRDPFLYVQNSKSYYNFVLKVDDDVDSIISKPLIDLLQLFSLEINNGKRIEETMVLDALISGSPYTVEDLRLEVVEKYGYQVSNETIHSCINNLNFGFVRKEQSLIRLNNDNFELTDEFILILQNQTFHKYLKDTVEYAIITFDKLYSSELFINGFLLYSKYSRKDVCRILNWEKNEESTVYGYKITEFNAPLFVTYKKAEDIAASLKYNDHFIDQDEFAWESRSRRTLDSDDVNTLKKSTNSGLRVLLFVQKSNDEGRDFYFMGDVLTIPDSLEQRYKTDKNGKELPVVHMRYKMKTPVADSIYKYLTDGF